MKICTFIFIRAKKIQGINNRTVMTNVSEQAELSRSIEPMFKKKKKKRLAAVRQ